VRAFIGLGSNLGDRLDNLKRALNSLEGSGIALRAVSSVYETEPVGPPQPDFLNAVCEVETDLPAVDLFRTLKRIEAQIGRVAGERWGPRVIDLDLLLYGDEMVQTPELVVPHPEMTRRAFVLVPLLEIAPEATLPSGELISSHAARGRVRKLGAGSELTGPGQH
jgi:2-amino-4-hydroxy-6-hydroxymethyldihydropteridine diphosphokinase